ncbi:MAG: patatin-like phospholipase family protein [Chloroflexota bacterium]
MTLREWLQLEPFTLTLSSGFFSFFAHSGMLSVLEDEGILPIRVSGSSAGALVGTLWASGPSMSELSHRLLTLTKKDFWDPSIGLGLLRGKRTQALIREIAGVDRLEACPIPTVVSVYDGFARTTHVLREGPLDQAVYASCAVPLMFQPIRINGRLYWDGGIQDRPGLAGIEEGARVFYHHIESRSPWRRKDDPALQIPERENMATLVIQGLPRVGPNRLEQGQVAFELAKKATQEALGRPLMDEKVDVRAA